jgi:polyhydroxybutyrate depolymerase
VRRGHRIVTSACAALLAAAACGGSDESDTKPAPEAGDDGSGGGGGGASGAGGTSGVDGSGAAGSSGLDGSVEDAKSDVAAGDASSGCNAPAPLAGKYDHALQSSGEAREFFVRVPAGYGGGVPAMVVLVFHGYAETAAQIEQISEMSVTGAAHGFLAVYPQGISTSWNAGKCCGSSSYTQRPDVQFVSDMIDQLEKSYCIDKKRVYAAGFSNGGMLSQRLGCELSHRIAAIGPVAGPLAFEPCVPARPVPVIEFHGTSDLIVPYNGSGLGGGKSVHDTIAFWVANNGCTDPQPTSVYSNGDSSCVEYQACAVGAAVRLCSGNGGGHQWPGGTSSGSPGKLTQDIDASEMMYEFFTAHPLP